MKKTKFVDEDKFFPLGKVLPAMITLASVAAGMTAILLASRGEFEKAVIAIILAAFFDGFDGRVARLFNAPSQFGVELDSLADSISFGVAPAFVMFFFTNQNVKSFGWIISIIFAICCVLRLARFNTMTTKENVPEYWSYFFTGVPAPAAAMLGVLPLSLFLATDLEIFKSPYISLIFMAIVALLMISRIPTLSLKKIRVSRNELSFIYIVFIILVGLLYFHFWGVVAFVWCFYFLTIPLSVIKFLKMKKEYEGKK